MKYILAALSLAFIFLACNTSTRKENSAGLSPSDSLLNKASPFHPVYDSSKLIIVKRNGKQLSYADYMQSFATEDLRPSDPGFESRDIDDDGNPELITNHFTGGAHCCDVTTILSRTGNNEFMEVLDYTGGTRVFKDTVSVSFFEALGYFHTCYACDVDYPRNIEPAASFIFKRGKFSLLPFNIKLAEDCEANLVALVSNGIPDKDSEEESGFDNGTRKMIAFNIVSYYYNSQRDLARTKLLFDKYYTHRDKQLIWQDLVKSISFFDEDIRKGIRLQ